MSLNIQIGNAEVVNLLVVQRVAELELEIEAKVKEREQIAAQEIYIGPPELKDGEKLGTDSDGRYYVVVQDKDLASG